MTADAPRLDREARPARAESFVARLGLAIVRPRRALAAAADRRYAGRSGSDLIRMIALLLLATQLRGLFAAAWLGVAVDLSFGFRGLTQVLTGSLTVDLALLMLGGLVVWAVAGPRRNVGRAFDLACVAALPLVYVDLAATVAVRAFDVEVPQAVGVMLAGASYAWMGVLIVFAVLHERSREAGGGGGELAAARRAGWGVIAVAVAGIAVQVVWLAQNLEQVRPMETGDRAPAFALPAIERNGVLGREVSLASTAGKVVIVDFWATWCKPCLASLPRLDALAKKHGDLVVLAINIDDPQQARELFDAEHYGMVLLEDDGPTRLRYGVSGIPHTVLIDRSGMVRAVVRGNESALEAAVETLYRR